MIARSTLAGGRLKLRDQLFLVLVAVAAAPVLIVSAMDARHSYQLRQDATAASLTGRAAAIQRRIDDYVDRSAAAVDALAHIVPLEHRANAAAWVDAMDTVRAKFPGFLTMLVTGADGRVLAAIRPDGARVFPPLAGEVADRAYFRRAMDSPQPFVSGVFAGRGLGNDPLVAVSRAFAGTDGDAGGIVEGSLDLRQLRQFAAEYSDRSTAIVILDAENRVTFSSAALPFAPLQDLSSLAFVRNRGGALVRYRSGKRKYIVARSSIVSAHGWKAFVFEPETNLDDTLAEWLRNFIAATAAGTVLCLIVARLAALRVTRPLEQLAEQAHNRVEAVTTGRQPDRFLPALRRGVPAEIAELHHTLEFMTSRVRTSYAELRRLNDELELRVEQRTLALNRNNIELQQAIHRKTEAEAELTLFQRAVAAASEGITISDALKPDQPLVYVNPAFETLTGYRAGDVLGRNCRFLQTPDANPAPVAEIRRAIEQHRSCVVEMLNQRKDGSPFWNRLSITPIQSAAGVVTHFVGIQVDITHHKEVEQLKNDLITTVSHELRTPLTSLYGFAELMLTRDFPPQRMRKYIEVIHAEGRRLTALINDFLDLERIAAGRETFDLRPVAIEPLLREAVGVAEARDEGRRFDVRVGSALPRILADAGRVRQVLGNLLSNACKFSPPGSTIEVSAIGGPEVVTVFVRDYGIGIPEDDLPKLFTRFFRVDNTPTRRTGGAGLGLELSKKLIEGQRGRIGVTSRPGEGSTFFFSLPVATPVETVEG